MPHIPTRRAAPRAFPLALVHAFALAVAAALAACGGASSQAAAPASEAAAEALPAEAVCPVMKNSFQPTSDSPRRVYRGRTYYFCCPGCDKTFDADPSKYAEM